MNQNTQKRIMYTALVIAFLIPLGCGTLQFGIEGADATAVEEVTPIGEAPQTPDSTEKTESEAASIREEEETETSGGPQLVVGWLGHVASLPEGAEFDDILILSPEGTGAIGLTGADANLEAEIVALRDKEEPGKFAHFWGTLNCEVEDYNNCQLVVTRLRYGASATETEPVEGWEGTFTTSTFNMGVSYVFVLSGDFPMWFSLDSNDAEIKSQLDTLVRDPEAKVRLWGELMTGVPDVNGSRIQVSQIEVLERGTVLEAPPTPPGIDLTEGWFTYTNSRYGYQISYPVEASLVEVGINGFPGDEMPDGMSPEEYMAQLEEEYGKNLCIRIEYTLGFIIISAPQNKEKMYSHCLRSGVGVNSVPISEDVSIGGITYTAHGIEGFGDNETLSHHNEWFRLEMADGTVIEYGSMTVENATFEDYLHKGKDMIRQILETFTLINE
jgi:hypothetical protein